MMLQPHSLMQLPQQLRRLFGIHMIVPLSEIIVARYVLHIHDI
jgi:hypothetical protein